jgi:hypothetical protein
MQQIAGQEGIVRLFRGPSGQIFRLWGRWTDEGDGALLLASSPDGVTWKVLTQVNPGEPGVSAREGQLAVNDAGDIALAYRWARARPPSKRVRLARSTDSGTTWLAPQDDISSGTDFDPQVAWGQGRTLVMAWTEEKRRRAIYEVHIRRSADGGRTWEPEVVVTIADDPTGVFSYAPRLAGDGKGRFWLVWVDFRENRSELRIIRSEDNARTWSSPQPLTGESFSVVGQTLTVAGNRLLLGWHDQRASGEDRLSRIYTRSSFDGGATWNPIVQVDGLPNSPKFVAGGMSAALSDSGEAWVAWFDNRHGRNDVFVARSPDGGATWGSAVRIDADSPGIAESRHPSLAVSPGGAEAAVVWEDDRNGPEAIYGRIFSGGQWSAETRLGAPLPAKRTAQLPSIITAGKDAFYVVWEVWDHTVGPRPQRSSLDSALLRVRASTRP